MATPEAPQPEEIRATREQADITQAELARVLHVDPKSISNWERGLVTPHPRHRRKLRTFMQAVYH